VVVRQHAQARQQPPHVVFLCIIRKRTAGKQPFDGHKHRPHQSQVVRLVLKVDASGIHRLDLHLFEQPDKLGDTTGTSTSTSTTPSSTAALASSGWAQTHHRATQRYGER
jgi:hypothetical protein